MKARTIEQDHIAVDVMDWSLAGLACIAVMISLFEASFWSAEKVLTLVVSIALAALICRHEFSLPDSRARFQPKTVFAFLGTIWIGVGGGVALAIVAAVAAGLFRSSGREVVRTVFTDIVCTFSSAVAYYIALGALPADTTPVQLRSVPVEVIYASVIMASTHFLVRALICYIHGRFGDDALRNSQPAAIALAGQAIMTVAASIGLFLLFNHFGTELGLIILPLAVAGNIAYGIHLHRLAQKTREISEASRIHLATVEALATAIDARDQLGIGHVRRTQIYAVGLGTLLNLSESELDALRTGALLHDIGKLAVPDHILNKPGKLTIGEMEKSKIHSCVGASILENVGFPDPVVPTVRHHHESWDGKGYPDGLAGEAIPLTARILTIADAFDTLRGARPYRVAIPREAACELLRSHAGKQFDPDLVDLFMRNLSVFEAQIAAAGLAYEKETTKDAGGAGEENLMLGYVEQIQSANREVFTLYSLAKDFSSALDIDETLSLFTRKIAEFVPFDTCLVYLADEGGVSATATHAVGLHAEKLRGRRVVLGEGATGYALKQKKAVNNVDPALDFAFSHVEIGHEYISMASLPLTADDRLVGGISLYSKSVPNYQDEHLRLVDTVSRIAADAIAKSLQHAEAEIYALTDPMTGLPNARSLQLHFDKEMKRAGRAGTTFQLLMLDLDGFKAVNDTYGHKAGDRLLKDLAAIIRDELRDYDFLARYAGDEFVAIVPETDSHSVLELSRRIEAAVNDFTLPVGDEAARVGVSIGSACFPNHGETFDQVMIAADKAMYLTKAVHKQRFETAETFSALQPEKTARPANHTSQSDRELMPDVDLGKIQIVEEIDGGLILELDESHIVSTAVN